MLSIDGINYEKKSAQYKAQISNAKKNGTRCFMLFIEKNAWKLLPLIKKEKDCAFFLFCPSSCLTEKFLDAVKLTKNLFISVAYNSNGNKEQILSTNIFNRLRSRKLPYGIHYYYSVSDLDNFKSGEIFKKLSKEKPLFSFFLSKKADSGKDTVTEEEKKEVEIQVKYEGYIKLEEAQVEKFKKLENKKLPKEIDYSKLSGLRIEARQKLNKIKPESVGQASRISGVSPADISVLLIYLEQLKRR